MLDSVHSTAERLTACLAVRQAKGDGIRKVWFVRIVGFRPDWLADLPI